MIGGNDQKLQPGDQAGRFGLGRYRRRYGVTSARRRFGPPLTALLPAQITAACRILLIHICKIRIDLTPTKMIPVDEPVTPR